MHRTVINALFLVLILGVFSPPSAHAEVLITEIMYAPEGADAKHEWIEVCASSDSYDIGLWKFFENGTNHGLSLVTGSSVLVSGECAVIADNADVFIEDYAEFDGNLFDSAFSLSNTGETLELKDGSLESVVSVSYSESDGAKDDGLSLHITAGIFTAATPTPGVAAALSIEEDTENSNQSTQSSIVTNTTIFSYESVIIEPPQDVYIRTPKTMIVTVGAPVEFSLESYDSIGSAIESGTVHWSFGDGGEAAGRVVSHRFVYEGTYTTTVSLQYASLSDEQQILVTVVPLQARLSVGEGGEWLALHNLSEHPLNLSEWRFVTSGQYFRIPKHTVVQSGVEVRFATELTKLTTLLRKDAQVFLVYPDGTKAIENTEIPELEEVAIVATSTVLVRVEKQNSIIGTKIKTVTAITKQEVMDIATSSSIVLLSKPQDSKSVWYWYVSLAAIISVALMGAMMITPHKVDEMVE